MPCACSHTARCAAVSVVLILGGCHRGSDVATGDVRGTITINGKPAQGVEVRFIPDAPMRPSIGVTDANGRYRAQFLSTQSGVPVGPCVVQFSVYRGAAMRNYLPKAFNTEASQNPAFHLTVGPGGLEFNYDIVYSGEIPPFKE